MKPHRSSQAGNTLVIVIVLLTTLGVFAMVALQFTSQQARFSRSSVDYMRAIALADSQLERMYDEWRNVMNAMPLGSKPTETQLAGIAALPGSFGAVHPYFNNTPGSFLSTYRGAATHTLREVDHFGAAVPFGTYSINVGPLEGFKGFYAINHTYEARVAVRVETLGQNAPTVEVIRTFTRSEAPVFQAAIYFEDDLELHPGESMTIDGPVISNRRIYSSVLAGKTLNFTSSVSANKEPNATVPGMSYNNRQPADPGYNETLPPGSPYNPANYTAPTFTSGKGTQLAASDRLEPAGREMRDAFNVADSNPNNDGFRELIEKPVSGHSDPAAIASFRFYNQASLRISVSVISGTQTISATYKDGTSVNAGVLARLQDAIGARKDVYDKREGTNVKVTPVDVAKLGEAIDFMNSSADPGQRFNGIVYFSDDSGGPGPWAFRMENASRLPTYDRPSSAPASERGFTVATAGGVYLQGDYNTYAGAEMVPAAVLADAVMFLSNAWQDANAANPIHGLDDGYGGTIPGTGRQASETTYRAAIMAGTIPSGYDPDNDPSTANSYGSGGGAHNFPRMLERWTGVNMNFKGSMVQLFTSKLFKGRWQTGDVYHPPTRNWSYNADFPRKPSPGLFSFTVYHRGPWRRN